MSDPTPVPVERLRPLTRLRRRPSATSDDAPSLLLVALLLLANLLVALGLLLPGVPVSH